MLKYQKYLLLTILFFASFFKINVLADSHSVNEILAIIQKDLKTLEKAVYSNSSNINSAELISDFVDFKSPLISLNCCEMF